jgi:hypothetical protein
MEHDSFSFSLFIRATTQGCPYIIHYSLLDEGCSFRRNESLGRKENVPVMVGIP